MTFDHTPVLIVGGSVVGLSTAMFLAMHGVECALVERHPSTSIHPRAVGYYPRTMELLRSAGLEQAAVTAAAGFASHRTRATLASLADAASSSRQELAGEEDFADVTPCKLLLLPQDRLEPLLRARAEQLGARLRFGVRMRSFTPDADGVDVELVDERTGEVATTRCEHLVAADGPRSAIRAGLGVDCVGRGVMSHHVSIAFAADLRPALGDRRFSVAHIDNERVRGILVHDDTLTGGTLIVGYRPQEGESLADFTDDRCAELVAAAIGLPDVDVAVRSRFPWDMAEQVATTFVRGRVALAGDAAHVIPPTGGYGANTGIADAHNLAWKLAMRLAGVAGPGLVDSYDAERRPVGGYVAAQGALQLAVRSGTASPQQRAEAADPMTVTMGYRYRSSAVVVDTAADEAPWPVATSPVGRLAEPGARAPHVPLRRDGTPLSSLDLFGRCFTLLVDDEGVAGWRDAARLASERLGVEVAVHPVAEAGARPGADVLVDPEGRWRKVYDVGRGGGVLVRPDGFVAWRSQRLPADGASVEAVLRRLLDR